MVEERNNIKMRDDRLKVFMNVRLPSEIVDIKLIRDNSMFFLLLVFFFLAVCISTIQMHSLTWQTYKGQNKVCMHVSSDRKYAMISAPTLNSCHYSTWLEHFWRNNKNSAIFPHFHFFFSSCCLSFLLFVFVIYFLLSSFDFH